MIKKEKVIGTQPGMEIVEVTYKNDLKSPQCFYDITRSLVIVHPGETKTWQEGRPKKVVTEPVKEAPDVGRQGTDKG